MQVTLISFYKLVNKFYPEGYGLLMAAHPSVLFLPTIKVQPKTVLGLAKGLCENPWNPNYTPSCLVLTCVRN